MATDSRSGRSAMVTGAARGIGRAIATRLTADGLTVSLCDLPAMAAELDAATTTIRRSGGTAQSLALDVTDADAVEAAVAAHVEYAGGLDVMVANAGIAVTAPLVETTPAQWEQTLAVNVLGVVHCYQAAARRMIDASYLTGQSIVVDGGMWFS